ncbi:CDP-alcohol phosphatidyltransferase family protein [Chitinibacteraceae bacterium HSL-7]
MTLYTLKPKFQSLLRPMLAALARNGITANQVTLVAALLSVALGGALAYSGSPALYWLLPLFLFIRMALNAIDGMLAREFGQQSRLGALLNELGDVISDAALYLPFALIAGAHAPWVVATVLLATLTEFIGVQAVTLGASRRYDGPFGKSDRAFVFGALALVYALYPAASTWFVWVFIATTALSALTCYQRARRALAEVNA